MLFRFGYMILGSHGYLNLNGETILYLLEVLIYIVSMTFIFKAVSSSETKLSIRFWKLCIFVDLMLVIALITLTYNWYSAIYNSNYIYPLLISCLGFAWLLLSIGELKKIEENKRGL